MSHIILLVRIYIFRNVSGNLLLVIQRFEKKKYFKYLCMYDVGSVKFGPEPNLPEPEPKVQFKVRQIPGTEPKVQF